MSSPIIDDVEDGKVEVIGIGAPPGTGKSAFGKLVADGIARRTGKPTLFIDNEWGFTREMRVECSLQSGLQLDTPEFARAFNRLGQIGYQAMIQNIAAQGVNVVFVGPFEDLTAKIGEKTVLEVLQAQFAEFKFKFHYVLMCPDEARLEELSDDDIMAPVEAEIRDRLLARSEGNPVQARLDEPKLRDPNYYRKRAVKVVHSAKTLNIGITRHSIGELPESVAAAVCEALYGD